jgi:hypothetical protein
MSLKVPRPALAAIGHEDRLSYIEHLSELRVRLILSAATLMVAFGSPSGRTTGCSTC